MYVMLYYKELNNYLGKNMEIYTTSQARTNLFKLVDYTAQLHEPVYIVGKKNKAVLMSEEDYRSLQETLYLTSIPGMVESILEASKEPVEDCIELKDIDDLDDL